MKLIAGGVRTKSKSPVEKSLMSPVHRTTEKEAVMAVSFGSNARQEWRRREGGDAAPESGVVAGVVVG